MIDLVAKTLLMTLLTGTHLHEKMNGSLIKTFFRSTLMAGAQKLQSEARGAPTFHNFSRNPSVPMHIMGHADALGDF